MVWVSIKQISVSEGSKAGAGERQQIRDEEKLFVKRIDQGIVLDHLDPGSGLGILKFLYESWKVPEDFATMFAMNIESKTHPAGKKDLIKMQGVSTYSVPIEKIRMLALIAPYGTLNIIKDYKVVEKIPLFAELPEDIIGMVKCSNPDCITNNPRELERGTIAYRHKLINSGDGDYTLRCGYCQRITKKDEVNKHLKIQ